MSKKLYISEYDSLAYEKSVHLDYMRENGIKEMKATEMMAYHDPRYFFCMCFLDIKEKGYCGKNCDEYKPRNGKKGICKLHTFTLEEKKEVIFKIK